MAARVPESKDASALSRKRQLEGYATLPSSLLPHELDRRVAGHISCERRRTGGRQRRVGRERVGCVDLKPSAIQRDRAGVGARNVAGHLSETQAGGMRIVRVLDAMDVVKVA
jgi:hypothetical protein